MSARVDLVGRWPRQVRRDLQFMPTWHAPASAVRASNTAAARAARKDFIVACA